MNPIIHTTQAESVYIGKNPTGVLIRRLNEQPPEGYEFSGITADLANFIAISPQAIKAWRNIPLCYPTGTYRMFAPKRVVRKSGIWVSLSPSWLTVPQKTDYLLDITTTVEQHDDGIWYEHNKYQRKAI